MEIVSLVENTSRCGLAVEHGLSLFIRLDDGRSVLFDMGQGRLFYDNAVSLGVDLSQVGVAVLSHGHYDHGGGLGVFLEQNLSAKVYVNHYAFEPHFSLRDGELKNIGLDVSLKNSPRIVFCSGTTHIRDSITIFNCVNGDSFCPVGNRLLFAGDGSINDDFCHEQNLIVKEGGNVMLFAGCAHSGIVNIIRRAEEVAGSRVTHVFAGMHLVKSGLDIGSEQKFISDLAKELLGFGCKYYTMHCTGVPQYEMLKSVMGDAIEYLSCGEKIII